MTAPAPPRLAAAARIAVTLVAVALIAVSAIQLADVVGQVA